MHVALILKFCPVPAHPRHFLDALQNVRSGGPAAPGHSSTPRSRSQKGPSRGQRQINLVWLHRMPKTRQRALVQLFITVRQFFAPVLVRDDLSARRLIDSCSLHAFVGCNARFVRLVNVGSTWCCASLRRSPNATEGFSGWPWPPKFSSVWSGRHLGSP
jgi:hypothetical protein